MDLTGLGVLFIGIAFLVFAIFLARVLNSFANVMDGVGKTVEELPKQLDTILNETGNLIHHSNNTLLDVNEKLGTLTPLFHIVGDIGESTRTISSSLVDVTAAMKKKRDKKQDEPTKNKRLGGIYGSTALGYYLLQKGKELTKGKRKKSGNKLYKAGEKRAIEIDELNEAVKQNVTS